jgi:ent-copalyl diphosphate synthase
MAGVIIVVAKLHAALLSGLSFLNQNMGKLAVEDQESMPIGFEIAFPSLIEIAKGLGVDFPYDHQALQDIYANREIKMKRCIISP